MFFAAAEKILQIFLFEFSKQAWGIFPLVILLPNFSIFRYFIPCN